MKYLIVFLLSVVCSQAQFLSGGRGGAGGSGSSAAAIPATIYYVATNGNNSTAVPGDATKPYLTPAAAATAAVNNSVIYLMPGVYTVTPYKINDADTDDLSTSSTVNIIGKTNITVRGVGAYIYGSGQGSLMHLKNFDTVMLDGITFLGDWTTTNAVAHTTNYAHVFLIGGGDSLKVKDCVFNSFGMYGIGSLDNSSVSANDNFLNIEVTGSVFKNGGATNVTGFYTIGGAVFAKCKNLSFKNNRCESLTDGITYVQQYKRGSSVIDNVYCLVANSSFNDIKNSVLKQPTLAAANGFTNENFTTLSANLCNNVGQDTPNAVGSSMAPNVLDILGGNNIVITANTFINYSNMINTVGVSVVPSAKRTTGTIANNIFRGFLHPILAVSTVAGNDIDGLSVVDNTVEGSYGRAIWVGGRNININNNKISSACTNATYSTSGQIVIAGSTTILSTNVMVSGNSFSDLPVGNVGNNIVFQSSTNCYQVYFNDNILNARLSAITNDLIMLRSTGGIRQKNLRATTTDNSAGYNIHNFYLPDSTYGIALAHIGAQSTLGGTTNAACYYSKAYNFKANPGVSALLQFGTGITTVIPVSEDGPLATCDASGGNIGSNKWKVQCTGTNSTTVVWTLDIDYRIMGQ